MPPEITLVKKYGLNALMSKRIFFDEQGQVRSDGSKCLMTRGTATRITAGTAEDLGNLITSCDSNQAIALGALKVGLPDTVAITTERRRKDKDNPHAIARTREFIDYRQGAPGWALIDIDTKGIPVYVEAVIEAAGGMWAALQTVAPGLGRAARVSRASTSAGLFRTDTGEAIPGSGGEHHYVLVGDASDIDRALTTLHDLCWLHGFGWYLIGSVGQLLDRSMIDSSARFGERLVFEGPPEVVSPLAQDAACRAPIPHDGDVIDTRTVIPSLSEYQLARVWDTKQRARRELEPRAAVIRAETDRRLAEDLGARTGMPIEAAMRAVAARHNGSLLPAIMLDFDHLGLVGIEAVLADPDGFIGETLADPLDGAGYGRGKAMVIRSDTDPHQILIHSFAHGRALYRLRHDARTANAAVAAADPTHVVDILSAIVAQAELEPDELTQLIATAGAMAKVGVRAIQARLKAERNRRDAAVRKASHEKSIARDSRMTRSLPPSDGERGPIIRFIDQVLAEDGTEEPPMRDATGAIVEVRSREPWGLHLLTATGSNAASAPADEGGRGIEGDAPSLGAPAEPVIERLSPIIVELLVERYIRFETEPTERKPSHAAALQRPFIDALIEMGVDGSKMPVGRAINTAPLVAINGTVIDGVGLDRDTGLIHRIEPQARACMPAAPPTEEDVREALRWLLDDWLVDVKADTTGKLLVLMLCLSMIERVLLKERPAWFITAGQRGGGKTTLVHMLTMAVFGRMAAAVAWSDSEEERRKALFSYLRQGVAVLSWDNIPRGAQITSAAIEKALTSPEVADRVLGELVFETAPGGTVQIFTGNNIAAKGDMCSRSFRIVINVDRPDPENRQFVHPDPLGWTMKHRLKILKSLYIILVFGCQKRPADQVAKTRFKDWWSLCGWPIEHAASLIGVTIDCVALLQAGESDDGETMAAATMLSVLSAEFGGAPFTAKQIIKIIDGDTTSFGHLSVPQEPHDKGERLLDTFSEMLGRRLDRPTAGSIGKLLRNRLVERPTFVADLNGVATLKKFSKGHTGQYCVDVRPSVASNNNTGDPAVAETISPISPISTQTLVRSNDKKGDEGDRGDTSSHPGPGKTETTNNLADVPAGEEVVV